MIHSTVRREFARVVVGCAVAGAIACAPPVLMPELQTAERYEHDRDFERALAAYDSAVERCATAEKPQRRRELCGQAMLGRAELLDHMGRREQAAAAYEAIPAAISGDVARSGKALHRAGSIRLALGQERAAYALLWRALTDFPDAPAADQALALLVLDGRRRAPRQLYVQLGRLAERLLDTELGDNLLQAMADLAEHELEDAGLALQLYDRLAAIGPTSALFDDALWQGARLARAARDFSGAVRRYRALLDSREIAWLNGTYNSEWHDDSQLQLGIVYRDNLAKPKLALASFAQLADDFPHSILLDDALWETAVTFAGMGESRSACAALASLHQKWPDSKYELELAPQLSRRLGCGL